MGKIPFILIIILFFNLSSSPADDSYQPTLSQSEKNCRQLSGNPVLDISTDITKGKATRRRLNDIPNWLIKIDFDNDDVDEIGVLFSDGTMKILSLEGRNLRTVSTVRNLSPDSLPVVVPYLGGEPTGGLVAVDNRGDLVTIDAGSGVTRRLSSGISPVTYPVAADLDNDGKIEIAAVSDEGEMTIIKGKSRLRSDNTTKLLPDTRIVVDDLDGDGTLDIIALSSPTDKHKMGRLGDDLEASGLAVFMWDGKHLKLIDEFLLPEGQVFETLIPSVSCEKEEYLSVILVVTEEGNGSWLQGFSYGSGRLRTGRNGPRVNYDKMIHLIGNAKLGDSERPLVVTALLGGDTDGDLELYRMDLAQRRTILKSGVFSHAFGSRLVETALIADFNSDSMLEILAPADDMSNLGMFSFESSRLRGSEVYSGNRKIATNLCSGDFDGNGKADVIFGLEDGTLIVIHGE